MYSSTCDVVEGVVGVSCIALIFYLLVQEIFKFICYYDQKPAGPTSACEELSLCLLSIRRVESFSHCKTVTALCNLPIHLLSVDPENR